MLCSLLTLTSSLGSFSTSQSTVEKLLREHALHGRADDICELMDFVSATSKPRTVGNTALYIAARSGHFLSARCLLGRADPNGRCSGGLTALHAAIFVNRLDIAALIVDHGGNVNQPDVHSVTPLILAVRNFRLYRNSQTVEFLLENGGDINSVTKTGSTLLHEAVRNGGEEALLVVESLLRRNVNVHAKNKMGLLSI